MKLVLAEKPSVAQSLAKCWGQTNAATDIWKATDMLSAGASAIWWSCPSRKPTMRPMPNGGLKMRWYRCCRHHRRRSRRWVGRIDQIALNLIKFLGNKGDNRIVLTITQFLLQSGEQFRERNGHGRSSQFLK